MDYVSGATVSPEKIAWLETHAPAKPAAAIDLGCGAGFYSRWLVEHGWRVEAFDITPLPHLHGVNFRAHNLEEGLPVPDQSADLLLAWDVLEHLVGEPRMWNEISRVLRPAGILIGSVPHAADQRLHPYNLAFKHHIDKTHQREYTAETLRQKMTLVHLLPVRIDLKGPVSPQVLAEFVAIPSLRRPVARLVGAARRLGCLTFGELHADLFFAAKKESRPES